MGYWGYLVAAKSDVPLDTLPELSTFGDDYVRIEPLQDGWQQAWVAGTEENPLTGARLLAKATGHPVIAALILDSDCGPIAAATPSDGTWTATLAKSTAIDTYQMPDDGMTAPAATASFALWAQSTGLPADHDLALQALDPDATSPESLFSLLLEATGIRPTRQ
jgi:hypothetical protein